MYVTFEAFIVCNTAGNTFVVSIGCTVSVAGNGEQNMRTYRKLCMQLYEKITGVSVIS